MKPAAVFLCLALAGFTAGADEDPARTGYAAGMTVWFELVEAGLELDAEAFIEGFLSAAGAGGPAMDRYEAMELFEAALDRAAERQVLALKLDEQAFLAANAVLPGVTVTASGLQYVVLVYGEGARPASGDTVIVHYEGMLSDGTVFDSSLQRGRPETFPLDMVIPGWTEGVQLMGVGGVYRFYIPSVLAYGERGVGAVIPPFATLIFTVELLGIAD